MNSSTYRKTTQHLLPADRVKTPPGQYNPYPVHPLAPGSIQRGFEALAAQLAQERVAILDGFPGVLWEHFQSRLAAALAQAGRRVHWVNVEQALYAPDKVSETIAPYLGGDDPLFGCRFPGRLSDFFDPGRLAELHPDPAANLNVIYGTGAALAGWAGALYYVDVPKNEIQFRARARSVKNIGAAQALEAKAAYKRSYFVDWAAANRHKAELLPKIDWIIDEQNPDEPAFMKGATLRTALSDLAHSFFRVRPWFEPGPWGGQWIKAHIPELAQAVPNYAWSFELIAPENGLLFESDGRLLEVSFDLLMFQEYQAVLGECAPNFRYEFPIRFDFLDTFEGGNLSIQVHPRPEYIRRHFGETFTQDECYYILDCAPQARVYLGFQAGIDPQQYKTALLETARSGQKLEIDRYVNSVPVQKHDLLLIPGGTVHGAGRGNLVLEISATTYIFTFKMYDWQRLDLEGKPRQLNIERACANLYFDRQGERISREFISHPRVILEGADWRIVHCPTHPDHFYDVWRLEFSSQIEVETKGSAHVLSLVEGQTVWLETEDAAPACFNYAETFVVPAAAGNYRLVNREAGSIQVVVSFMKPAGDWKPDSVPGQ